LKFWLDAQFSPAADDADFFAAARRVGAIVITKDRDFVYFVERLGSPPQILWVTLGNTSNARMRDVLSASFPDALVLLQEGEPLVELGDASALRR
jgi:predicted nuclease of predicted toxin-antitoxin system